MTSADSISRIYSEIEEAHRADCFVTPWDLYGLLGDAYSDTGDTEIERVCRWLVSHKQRPFVDGTSVAYWHKRIHATSRVASELPAHIHRRVSTAYRSLGNEKAFPTIRGAVEALRGLV